MGRLQEFHLTEHPSMDPEARQRPMVAVDRQVHEFQKYDGALVGDVVASVGMSDKYFDRFCEAVSAPTVILYDMRVADLGPIRKLKGVRRLMINWNTKVEDISPLATLTDLEVLRLCDLKRRLDLAPLRALQNLEALEFSGGIWSKNHAVSLEPLSDLPKLRELSLLNLKVDEGGLRPLAGCRALREMALSNQFEIADYAYLKAHLPDTSCESFAGQIVTPKSYKGMDVMIVGKRKPFLNPKVDGEKIAKYIAAFDRLVEEFRAAR